MNFGTTVGETDHIWSVNMHLEILRPPARLIGQFPVTAIDIQPGAAGGCSTAHHRVETGRTACRARATRDTSAGPERQSAQAQAEPHDRPRQRERRTAARPTT